MKQPVLNVAPATKVLLLLCIAAWIAVDFIARDTDVVIENFAFIPAIFKQHPWTLLTYQFLHGGFLHLAVNGAMLAALGNGIEPLLRPARFVAYFLICGALAALAEYALHPMSDAVFVGASGSISGLLGGYLTQRYQLTKHSSAKARTDFIGQIILITAGMAIIGIFNIPNTGAGIAWVTHIAGLLSGIALWPLFKPQAGHIINPDLNRI